MAIKLSLRCLGICCCGIADFLGHIFGLCAGDCTAFDTCDCAWATTASATLHYDFTTAWTNFMAAIRAAGYTGPDCAGALAHLTGDLVFTGYYPYEAGPLFGATVNGAFGTGSPVRLLVGCLNGNTSWAPDATDPFWGLFTSCNDGVPPFIDGDCCGATGTMPICLNCVLPALCPDIWAWCTDMSGGGPSFGCCMGGGFRLSADITIAVTGNHCCSYDCPSPATCGKKTMHLPSDDCVPTGKCSDYGISLP